jgi:ATP-dependent Clp protease adaptor protein ClpS
MNKDLEKDDSLKSFRHLDKKNTLVLYNDDENSFEHVIESLVRHCNFELVQAEQLAIIAHFKGKATITKGQIKHLSTLRKKLNQAKLQVELF